MSEVLERLQRCGRAAPVPCAAGELAEQVLARGLSRPVNMGEQCSAAALRAVPGGGGAGVAGGLRIGAGTLGISSGGAFQVLQLLGAVVAVVLLTLHFLWSTPQVSHLLPDAVPLVSISCRGFHTHNKIFVFAPPPFLSKIHFRTCHFSTWGLATCPAFHPGAFHMSSTGSRSERAVENRVDSGNVERFGHPESEKL